MQTRKYFQFDAPVRVFACIFLLLVGGIFLSHSNVVSGGTQTQASAPSNPDQVIFQDLQQALKDGQLSAADRQNLQQKLALQENLIKQRAAAGQNPGPKGPAVPPKPVNNLLPEPTPDARERIISGSESLVHAWEANVNNLWQGAVNGTYYQVLAGSTPENAGQGLLIVIEYHTEQNQRIQRSYLAPALTGALRIVGRQGGRLLCETASGSTIYFDLEARAFQP